MGMIEHDNNTVYYFPTIKAAMQFTNSYRNELLFPAALLLVRRDCKEPIYFYFYKVKTMNKLDWAMYTTEGIRARKCNIIVYCRQRSE